MAADYVCIRKRLALIRRLSSKWLLYIWLEACYVFALPGSVPVVFASSFAFAFVVFAFVCVVFGFAFAHSFACIVFAFGFTSVAAASPWVELPLFPPPWLSAPPRIRWFGWKPPPRICLEAEAVWCFVGVVTLIGWKPGKFYGEESQTL